MCAICGIFDLNSGEKADKDVLERMLAAIRHRGA